ncbi:MAG: exodeoxyribonuclease V subunit alpha [Actinomycetes bacterium]|nr:exodeoxyribonuclease V subunit alpha [Acidimicrobiia bacterium]
MNDRIALAAQDPNVVVHAHGLLAEFNEAGVLAPVDVASAQAVSRLLGETDEAVTLAAALAVRGTRFGHVCVRVSTLRESVVVDGREAELVEALPWPEPDEWLERLRSSSLVGDGSGEHPLVLSDDRLYLERYWRYEQQVAGLIRDRLGRGEAPLAPATEETLRRLLAEDGETTQFRAARVALASKLAVIAGGPGTGKTYAVGAMLVALAAAGAETFPLVGLCAPTGKAAARLGQAITELARDVGDPAISAILEQVTPQTIHRLLGWAWGRSRFRHDGSNRLPHDIVIVDEMSMVSLPLAARLLAALRDDATLVIVGDPFQLESIEAGTVLADIVGPAADRPAADTAIAGKVTVLDRVYRFEEDSSIADFADAVRRGDPDDAVERLADGGDRLRWVRSPEDPEFAAMWREVTSQRSRLVDLANAGDVDGAIQALTEVAVVCATKRGPNGVSQWSRSIELALDERYPGLRWDTEWYPGRPVMITRNDYNLDLYNGDIGVAVATVDGLRAVFERGEVRTFPLSHLPEHQTVHAMTIHKSQGSQFDQVVVVLPDEESRLLTRELLYTAVTRARRRVWVVSPENVVRRAVSRSVQRASGLAGLLWGAG